MHIIAFGDTRRSGSLLIREKVSVVDDVLQEKARSNKWGMTSIHMLV